MSIRFIENYRIDSPPVGPDVWYLCTLCNSKVRSIPVHAESCACYNVIVDIDAGRFSLKNPSEFKVFVLE